MRGMVSLKKHKKCLFNCQPDMWSYGWLSFHDMLAVEFLNILSISSRKCDSNVPFPGCCHILLHLESIMIDKDNRHIIHSKSVKLSLDSDTFLGITSVDMYIKCGCLSEAQTVFQNFSSKGVVFWNAQIVGYLKHGLAEGCFKKYTVLAFIKMLLYLLKILGNVVIQGQLT